MLINDRIYGEFEITEPVLLELINSRALQRLKGISQMGPPAEFYHIPVYTRYEHSIGVMLLLRKLGAALDEQIAGLLHDASHTAFSHVIDYLWGDSATEDFQDNNHLSALRRFGVEEILKGYGFDIKKIADLKSFHLLDRDIPNLCADRVDYFLRELCLVGKGDLARKLLPKILISGDRIFFSEISAAKIFAENFLARNMENWGGFEAVSRYHQLALILKRALNTKIIQSDDMWQDDNFIIKKLYGSNDTFIINGLESMKNKVTSIKFGITVDKKFRYVDPEVMTAEGLRRLSVLDPDFGRILEEAKIKNSAGMAI